MNTKRSKTKTTETVADEVKTPPVTEQVITETAAPAPDETNISKKKKSAKSKVIRDSFSFPEQDYLKITELKKLCLAQGIHVKKGELLRAGLQMLSKLTIEELTQVVEQVEKVKTGRPNS